MTLIIASSSSIRDNHSPAETAMRLVITHSKPDGDAIASAWLAARYMFPGEHVEVAFVARFRPGQPVPAADCLVDIGCAFEPQRLAFDHKPPAFVDRNQNCATRLVWEHLLSLGRPVGHLGALVRVVHEGDRSPPGRPSSELAKSRSEGFHSRLKQARARGGGDYLLYREMRGWLDCYDRDERARHELMRTPIPSGTTSSRADVDGLGVAPASATRMTPGDARDKRTGRTPRRPDPAQVDDEHRTLVALLLEHGLLCQGRWISTTVAEADRAGRVAALREAIGDRLARSQPGSKATRFLRGLRVLVEVEAIAPGHLDELRRKADGWLSPLSLARGKPGRQAGERVAKEYRVDAEEMGAEVKFAEAVEVIARNCGDAALGPLLTPGGRLREGITLKVARKGPERQRYMMERAARGLDPLARPAEGLWPMDTRDFAKVPGRLGRALGLVEGCMAGVPALLDRRRPSRGEEDEIRRLLTQIIECSEQLLRLVEERGVSEVLDGAQRLVVRQRSPKPGTDEKPRRTMETFARVRGKLDAARYFVEKTARDVPRLPPGMRPTPRRASQVRGQLRGLIVRARTLIQTFETRRPRRST